MRAVLTKMEWKYLQAAAFYDNDSFIKDYLEQYESSEQNKGALTKILHKAAESCSIKVVEVIINSPHGMDYSVQACKISYMYIHLRESCTGTFFLCLYSNKELQSSSK